MSKWTKRAIGITLTIAVCLTVWKLLAMGGEPVYEGKRLTQWIDEYREQRLAKRSAVDHEKLEEAEDAIRQIGTNAIPTLLEMVAAKDSAFKKQVAGFINKQTLIEWRIPLARELHSKSSFGFGPLGPTAKPAVPELIELLSDPDRDVRATAAHTLSLIGPDAKEAVPALVRLLNETGNGWGPVMLNSMHALGAIHSAPEKVVPLLQEYVNGSRKDWNYGTAAESALRRFDMANDAVAYTPVSQLHDSGDYDPITAVKSGQKESTNE